MTFTEIVEEIDDINCEAISGEVDYKEYKEKVDTLNNLLKEEESI